MLSRDDLLTLYQRLGLSDEARSIIDQVRSSDPARRVRSGRGNVSGRYPSKKMGMTIQFESHRVELAAIYEMEHDAHVLEYFDQPPSIKLLYDSAHGKSMGVLHTPDFLVIRDDAVGWEEWKTEEDLNRLSEHNQNRYQRDETGRWRCPPGEAYASRSGLYYRVRSAQEIDWVFQRNTWCFSMIICGQTVPHADRGLGRDSWGMPSQPQGFRWRCCSMRCRTLQRAMRSICWIATGVLSVDIRSASLREPARVVVFAPPVRINCRNSLEGRPDASFFMLRRFSVRR